MTEQFLIGVAFAFLISVASYFARFLTLDGSIAQFILGSILLGFGGWRWTVPMVAFFILSSLLSKFGKKRRVSAEAHFEKSSHRDAMQVVANGGFACLITLDWLATSNDVLYVAYLGAVAAATADTWGTELGTLSRSAPVLITNLKQVEAGRSGAVSLLGVLAGVAGCLAILLSAFPWIRSDDLIATSVAVVSGGVVGSLADSALGATLQAQFRCIVCKRETERLTHCEHATEFISGFRFLRNDGVNLLCSIGGGAVSHLLFPVF
jgi:uncharacterized protein (TIGR00297 family)